MTWADGVLLIVMVVSAILSFLRGFVREVLGVAAWIGAALAAFRFRDPVVSMLGGAIEPDWLAEGVAVGVVFLVVLVVLKLVIHALAGRVQSSPLGGVDRSLGAIFGLARGAFIAALAFVLAGLFVPAVERWPEGVREARALPLVVDVARWVVGLMPEEYRPRIAAPPERREPTQEDLMRPPARNRT
ncbi:CvpA family protein [Roseococcus pinisoli]|uniref:CvpA family protein n=1 Tax=Roseococcus pinisoli TaxID=2835040 RepID=A0ABS5QB22_9PROT|nr:CvpA family protein [Roseococcus pinisoli]MBS7810638.1 CvpA family protein [Roseococcus pinisoli]